eukprot:TRINITY_DN13510_c0_g1_i1.p1 TRINITY_DN13510_c0_g1~~TRINITY_DN13510_c0_g1_i1.p1  ORF type:complete len:158 (-),score=17.58 TRINITY_DN13510_c0_g1_i1:26-499(-)
MLILYFRIDHHIIYQVSLIFINDWPQLYKPKCVIFYRSVQYFTVNVTITVFHVISGIIVTQYHTLAALSKKGSNNNFPRNSMFWFLQSKIIFRTNKFNNVMNRLISKKKKKKKKKKKNSWEKQKHKQKKSRGETQKETDDSAKPKHQQRAAPAHTEP